ncbi:hypothetical protein K9M78_08945, partial [Candidatus Bipolaricaulota bacterium]|nr:hypothetical protein [Candidatus Bipolaricaulota bacterium]
PEISDEIISELDNFTAKLENTIGLGGVEIKKPINKDRSATRGAVINHFDQSLLDPDSFSTLMENYNH